MAAMFIPDKTPFSFLPLGLAMLTPLALAGQDSGAGPTPPAWTQAEEPTADLPSEVDEALAALQAALQDSEADFEAAYRQATEAGVEEQTLFEASIVHRLRSGDLQSLIRLAPTLPPLRDELEYGNGRLFASPMDFEAFVEAVYARRAYTENDLRAFGAYARNAYWKGPQWVERLGITALVLEERHKQENARLLADVRLPLDRPLPTAEGGSVTLRELLAGNEAVLLDLWGSWCEPCIANFPRLQARADEMKPHGVVVVGLNLDEENQEEVARRYQELHNMQMPWLIDPLEDSLSLQLRIGTVPRVALIGKEGEILFTGLPSDPELIAMLNEFKGEEADAGDQAEAGD